LSREDTTREKRAIIEAKNFRSQGKLKSAKEKREKLKERSIGGREKMAKMPQRIMGDRRVHSNVEEPVIFYSCFTFKGR